MALTPSKNDPNYNEQKIVAAKEPWKFNNDPVKAAFDAANREAKAGHAPKPPGGKS